MLEKYIEINTKNINENIKNITKKYNEYEYIIAVIKGNCYGHGFETIKYINDKINYFATSTLEEAQAARKYTNLPILCLHPIDIKDINTCIKNNITITITNYNFYKLLLEQKLTKKLKVHLKINTGMNRLGLDDKTKIKEIYDNLINNDKIILEGIYTHMATLGITDENWDNQIKKFKYLTENINLNKVKIKHIFSSNSLLLHKKLNFCNGIRIGQIMFNSHFPKLNTNGIINKLKNLKRSYIRKKLNLSELTKDQDIKLKNTFTLISKIIEIKNVKENETIGYDATYIAKKNCKVATIPIGYNDGLSPKTKFVIINNKKYQIIGEINMCMATILVDDTIKINDKVILLNENTKPNQPLPYLWCNLDSGIKRIYK